MDQKTTKLLINPLIRELICCFQAISFEERLEVYQRFNETQILA